MACPTILTGKDFLAGTLAHIDCQAQTLGSYGFAALAQPGSVASLAMTGLLTLFVGLFAVRLMFGPAPGAGDIVQDLLKVGIVLTLALSWPAWRTMIYDVTLKAPAEIAASIAPPSLSYGSDFDARLQNVDTGFIALTVRGTGRNIGELTDGTAPPAGFRGVALEDETGFAMARLIFLSGTIGSLAIVRLAAGLLLALTPLAAGLLLFNATRGLFSGWLRGLVLTVIGSVGITVVLATQLALLEPLLTDALRLREFGYATPAAPTELVALTAGFALALFGILILLGKVAFQRGWPDRMTLSMAPRLALASPQAAEQSPQILLSGSPAPSRAFVLSDRMASTVRNEQRATISGPGSVHYGADGAPASELLTSSGRTPKETGGRRSSGRVSAAAARRDARS